MGPEHVHMVQWVASKRSLLYSAHSLLFSPRILTTAMTDSPPKTVTQFVLAAFAFCSHSTSLSTVPGLHWCSDLGHWNPYGVWTTYVQAESSREAISPGETSVNPLDRIWWRKVWFFDSERQSIFSLEVSSKVVLQLCSQPRLSFFRSYSLLPQRGHHSNKPYACKSSPQILLYRNSRERSHLLYCSPHLSFQSIWPPFFHSSYPQQT